jgi:hypothetical protein
MSQYMATNRLYHRSEHRKRSWVCHALIHNYYRNIELFCQPNKMTEMLTQLLLSFRKFASPWEFDAK